MSTDTSDMLLIHRVLRRELGALPRLIRDAAGDPVRAKRVGAHATETLDFLHTHHSGEDTLLYPLLKERASGSSELFARMDSQHGSVDAAITSVRKGLPAWSTSGDAELGERLAGTLDEVLPLLTDHLRQEEDELLPLASTTVSKAEWDKLGEHGFGAIAPKRRLVVLGHILEEADPAERAKFMKNVPPPARLAYRVIGVRQFAKETAALRGPLS